MKRILLALLLLVPVAANAQTFEGTEPCRELRTAVKQAASEAAPIENLLTDNTIAVDSYLEQLYSAVRILSQSGEAFFKATDRYESECMGLLSQSGKTSEIRPVYDLYLQPVKQAYQFFARARTQAIRLGREKDVNTFVKAMREYEDAVQKIADACESALKGQPNEATCKTLSSQLEDAVKPTP